ncbi:MAG: MFS transporter, partial [Gammaproteobacteria bacterium]|nr:MFS transporter [Gammaproteobacteria bacterium]
MFLTPLIGMGLDLYTPSLPAISTYFHISYFQANLTIIFYIAGFGIAQPLMGIISDRFPRKLFTLCALAVYCLSSFASARSQSIDMFYCYRAINSISASCIAVVIKSILMDYFVGKTLAKANNYFTLSWSLTPMIAPVIGGYLQHYYSWQSNFYFMGLYGLMGFILCLSLLKKQKEKNTQGKILPVYTAIQKWKILFSDRVFIASGLILAVENAILFTYYTVAPFIIQTTLHFNAEQYGKVMLFAGGSYVFGNVINGWLLNYYHVKKIISAGLILSIIIVFATIATLILFKNDQVTIYFATIPIFLLFACDGLIFSNIMSHALPRHSNFSGTAGGLLAGLLNILAALIVAFCTHFFDMHDLFTLNFVYFILLFLSLLVFILCKEEVC